MLNIWLDTDRKANTRRVLEAVCAEGDVRRILIVPEQFSHATERALCRVGGNGISRRAEVLTFSRLANRVFSERGGIAESETDAGGKLLMMSLAVENVREKLKIYGNSATKPELLRKLIDTLEEFRSYCITAETLFRVSRSLEGALAVKTEEFALLMESYDAVAANLGQNPDTKLNRLLAALEEAETPVGKCFFFNGFTDFNGVECEIIAQLLAMDAEVTVALLCDGVAGEKQQFNAARQTAARLAELARRQSVAVRMRQFEAAEETALTYLREHLFGGAAEAYAGQDARVTFLSAADPQTECRIAAGEILRLTEQGVRPREICVACADASYLPALRAVFARADIPSYFAGDRDIMQQPSVHLLLSALEAAETLETEPMLEVLKSGLLPLADAAGDRLENYILLWSIRGEKWGQEWKMSPYGYRKRVDDAAEAQLAVLNADKTALIAPILHLRAALLGAKNTGEMTLALHAFAEEISLRETLSARAEALYRDGELRRAQEYAQVYGIICRVMEQLYGVLGQSVRSVGDFARIFRTVLTCYSVGTIPATLDCVHVGDLMSQRRADCRVLFLLGANEGAFPAAMGNQTLLTDSERTHLTQAGLTLDPTSAGRLETELAAIDSVLAAPRERLYLGAGESAAYFCRRARLLFPTAETLCDDDALVARSEREYLTYLVGAPTQRERLRAEFPALCDNAERLADAARYEFGSLSHETVQKLYDTTLHLSSSRIDRLAECRFAHFLRYGLDARERETAELDASLYGTFVHDILEHTGREVQRRGGFRAVDAATVRAIAEARMEYYVQTELAELMHAPRTEFLLRRSFDEILAVVAELHEELRISQFEPTWFELHFGDGEKMPAVRIVGEKMTAKLGGIVDRVDLWRAADGRAFVRVIDYKTGKTSFDYTKVFYGLGMQMLLYLFALARGSGRLLGQPSEAAGVLYFPARVERVVAPERPDESKLAKLREKTQQRSGLLLDREDVLHAMEPNDDPRYLPYARDKEGARTGALATKEQFAALQAHVFHTVARLGDELYDGVVAPNPYYCDQTNNACRWCPFGDICKGQAEKRWLTKLPTAEAFWAAVEKGAAHE